MSLLPLHDPLERLALCYIGLEVSIIKIAFTLLTVSEDILYAPTSSASGLTNKGLHKFFQLEGLEDPTLMSALHLSCRAGKLQVMDVRVCCAVSLHISLSHRYHACNTSRRRTTLACQAHLRTA
jgi:hypothetical protein